MAFALLVVLASHQLASQDCGLSSLFTDGFERGDDSAWTEERPAAYEHVAPSDIGHSIGVGVVGPVPTLAYQGSLTIDQSMIIEDRVIDGCVRIAADGVTLRNVVIDCGGLYPIRVNDGHRDFTIEYSTIRCRSSSKMFFFPSGAPDALIQRNDATGCQDFFFAQGDLDGVRVFENSMRALEGTSSAHADGFQLGEAGPATGMIHVRGNYFAPENETIGITDLVFGTNDSAVELLIENNFIEPWGRYTLRCGGVATRCVVRHNTFSSAFQNQDQPMLLANSGEPSEFCCNRSESGGFVEEFYDGRDQVIGAEHVAAICPGNSP